MIFVTSDTHFGHEKKFLFEPRHFKTISEMNEAIVERWNSVVGPEDEVYHLGDVMLGSNDVGMDCLRRLNGKIHILIGNHDTATRLKLYETLPNVDVVGYATMIKYGKYRFYLSHYPTNTSNLENMAPLSQHTLGLYGHTHQQTNFYQDIPYMYHVGMDSHDSTPVSIEQVLKDIRAKRDECIAMLDVNIEN